MVTLTLSRRRTERRAIAQSMGADTGYLERKAVATVARIGAASARDLMTAYRRGGSIDLDAILARFDAALPILRDAMVYAHLAGYDRVRKMAGVSLSLAQESLHARAIEGYVKRLSVSQDWLSDVLGKYEKRVTGDIAAFRDRAKTRLGRTIETTTREGEHVREGVRQLGQTFDALGLTPANSFNLEAIFRTETHLAYSAGEWDGLQDPAVQEILWGYEYATAGDDRVRDRHAEWDGVILPKNDPWWDTHWPPNGWACRCKAIPLFDEEPVKVPTDNEPPDKGFAYHAGQRFGGGPPGASGGVIVRPNRPSSPRKPLSRRAKQIAKRGTQQLFS